MCCMPTRRTGSYLFTRLTACGETELRLYELEQRLAGAGFTGRESLLLNFDHIRALRPDFGGRLLATLSNGENGGNLAAVRAPAFRKNWAFEAARGIYTGGIIK